MICIPSTLLQKCLQGISFLSILVLESNIIEAMLLLSHIEKGCSLSLGTEEISKKTSSGKRLFAVSMISYGFY
jgi:hypothetical protein